MPAPALPLVAEALLRLQPVRPAEPHLLERPDDLESKLTIADVVDDKLPLRHQAQPVEPEPVLTPEEREFERLLAKAKRAADPHWMPDSYKAFLAPGEEGHEGDEEPERLGRRARGRSG